ncbi:hypothetical protein [Sphingobacterium lumbrici]|uniref:hypothetical protein n=1 Tax=Sphingobacterium lumbrici TaxID=2559600 RepID=UPI0011296BC2|nr:hypothetical protein [Sphingobacterium lumbrici]
MENILITLVLVGGLIYNIYNNYKKEMEKTAKRDVRTPTPPVSAQVPPMRTPPPVIAMGSIPAEVSHIQKYKSEKKNVSKQSLAVQPLEDEITAFDLRQAVIYATILDRPHK